MKRNGAPDHSVGMGSLDGGARAAGPPPRDAIERACSMKEDLLRQIESLGKIKKIKPNENKIIMFDLQINVQCFFLNINNKYFVLPNIQEINYQRIL